MEGLKAELAALESDLEAHERNTVDYRHAIEKYDGVIKENSSKIRHWKKDVSCPDKQEQETDFLII